MKFDLRVQRFNGKFGAFRIPPGDTRASTRSTRTCKGTGIRPVVISHECRVSKECTITARTLCGVHYTAAIHLTIEFKIVNRVCVKKKETIKKRRPSINNKLLLYKSMLRPIQTRNYGIGAKLLQNSPVETVRPPIDSFPLNCRSAR